MFIHFQDLAGTKVVMKAQRIVYVSTKLIIPYECAAIELQ